MTVSRQSSAPGWLPMPRTGCLYRTGQLALQAALLALALPVGCEKSEPNTASESTASASPTPTTPLAPSATASPSDTPRASAATVAPSATPNPTARAAAPPTGATAAAPGFDQAELVRISAAAGLPVPPELSAYPPDIAAWLDTTIRATAKPTADTIGLLGCLYHDITTNREDSERAQQCYEKAKELDPQSYVWPHLLGRLFLRRQSDVRARMEFNASIALNPDYPDNYAWLGDLELQANAPEEARKHYTRMIERSPEEAYGHAGLAQVELDQGNLPAAKTILDQAMSLDARNQRVHTTLAHYYEKTGDAGLAQRHAAFARQLPPAATSQSDPINTLLLRAAGPTTLAVSRVRTLAQVGDVTSAFKVRDELLSYYPENPTLLTACGEVSLMLRRTDEAMTYFQKALATDPNHARAYVGMADGLAAGNRLDEALQQADRAITIDPTLPAAYVARGRILQAQNRGDDAVAAIKKAIELQPGGLALRTAIGDMLLVQGKLQEAKDWCTQIIRTAEASGKVDAPFAPVYVTLGNVAEQEGNADVAARNYTFALQADPTLEPVFRRLAQLLIQLGRGEDALKLGQQLRDMNPQILEYAITYGTLLSTLGKNQEAVVYFEEMSKALPDHPAPRYAQAVVYRELNETEKAQACLQEVIKLQPTYEAAWVLLFDFARTRGDGAAAIDVLRTALEKIPDSPLLNNSFAWVLATSDDPSLRDPKRAVELAEQVVNQNRRQAANYLDTLACAYAADGRLEEAIKVEQEAVARAESANQTDLAQEFKERIAVFESGKAYVEKL